MHIQMYDFICNQMRLNNVLVINPFKGTVIRASESDEALSISIICVGTGQFFLFIACRQLNILEIPDCNCYPMIFLYLSTYNRER